jgi:hypothetical protein
MLGSGLTLVAAVSTLLYRRYAPKGLLSRYAPKDLMSRLARKG